jgi:uncharacterized protein YqhQ
VTELIQRYYGTTVLNFDSSKYTTLHPRKNIYILLIMIVIIINKCSLPDMYWPQIIVRFLSNVSSHAFTVYGIMVLKAIMREANSEDVLY